MKGYLVVMGDANGTFPLNPDGRTGSIPRKNVPTSVYYSEEEAVIEAQRIATLNPRVSVFLFEATGAIETKTPQFIAKTFNSSGELAPVKDHVENVLV